MINEFVSGEDFIVFEFDRALGIDFQDANVQANTFSSGNVNLLATGSGATAGADIVFISTAVTGAFGTSDTTHTNAILAIGTLTTGNEGTTTASDPQNDAIFVVKNAADNASAIYLYIAKNTDTTIDSTSTSANELTLLATVDEVLVQGDVIFQDTF